MNSKNCFQRVFEYHERTKHLPSRPASSSGYLDWANEPNPFRSYEGTNTLKLPFTNTDQGLYHFTIRGALEDKRITTLQPYYHLKDKGKSATG